MLSIRLIWGSKKSGRKNLLKKNQGDEMKKMYIKKMLLLFAFLISVSNTVYGNCPSYEGPYDSLHKEYICKRYVQFMYSGARYMIDLSKVQMIFNNKHDFAKMHLSPPPTLAGIDAHYYVVFDGGSWVMLNINGTNPKPTDAWYGYRNFLIQNPSFMRF